MAKANPKTFKRLRKLSAYNDLVGTVLVFQGDERLAIPLSGGPVLTKQTVLQAHPQRLVVQEKGADGADLEVSTLEWVGDSGLKVTSKGSKMVLVLQRAPGLSVDWKRKKVSGLWPGVGEFAKAAGGEWLVDVKRSRKASKDSKLPKPFHKGEFAKRVKGVRIAVTPTALLLSLPGSPPRATDVLMIADAGGAFVVLRPGHPGIVRLRLDKKGALHFRDDLGGSMDMHLVFRPATKATLKWPAPSK